MGQQCWQCVSDGFGVISFTRFSTSLCVGDQDLRYRDLCAASHVKRKRFVCLVLMGNSVRLVNDLSLFLNTLMHYLRPLLEV